MNVALAQPRESCADVVHAIRRQHALFPLPAACEVAT